MKKKLFAFFLLCLSTLPAFAYVRDDTETGGGFWSAIFTIGAIIFFMLLGDNDKKK